MVPRAVLMKSGLVSVNTARQVNVAHSKTIVNAARPKSHFSKLALSTIKRPIHKNTTFKNNNFNQRVNIVKDKNVNTVRPKVVVNAARPKAVVNAVQGNNVNAVKATVKAKTVNGEVQLQTLVDGGVYCLPNATIFEQLTLMGYEKISQKLTFYKGCLLTRRIYIALSHTKKIFGNMRRVRKGFSGRETPLFQTMMVQDQEEIDEGSEMQTDPHHTPTIIQPSTSQPQKKQRSRRSKRKDTEDSGNIDKTQSKATLNESSSSGTSSDSGSKRHEMMGDTIAQTRSENVSKLSNDPLLARGNTLQSCKDILKLEKLMALCTTLQSRVLALETTKTTQATEIASLKKRVESSEDEGLGEEDAYKHGRIADIDANKDIYLVNVKTDKDMFGVNDLDGDEVIVESVYVVNTAEETRNVVEEFTAVIIPVSAAITTTTTTAITDVEMTLAHALAELKSAKPKADKVVMQEPEQGTTTPTLTTTTDASIITAASTRPRAKGLVIHEQEQASTPTVSSQQPSQVKVQDKGKGKMVEPEPVKKISKKELIRLDEELAFKLQAKEEEKERLAREKAQQRYSQFALLCQITLEYCQIILEVIVKSVDVVNTIEETRSVVKEVTVVTIPVSAAITTTTTTAITDVEMTLA
ncbi:hypothetical protein Tco_0791406 [Tanacetum coccineum]